MWETLSSGKVDVFPPQKENGYVSSVIKYPRLAGIEIPIRILIRYGYFHAPVWFPLWCFKDGLPDQ